MTTELRPDPNLTAADPSSNGQATPPVDWTCVKCGAHDADDTGPHTYTSVEGNIGKLAAAGIETIGKLQEYQEPTADGWTPQITDLKGVGAAAIEKLDAALEHFWAERAKAKG